MSSGLNNQYRPDTVSPPGDTLREVLESRGMTQIELARRMGRARSKVNDIIQGRAAITHGTALQLERALGVPASFWNNRERHYREFLELEKERRRLEASVGWLKMFPIDEMVKKGWIQGFKDKVDQLRELLSFFGVVSPEHWEQEVEATAVAYRKARAFESDPGALAAWLRRGELCGEATECAPYERARFKNALHEIRGLTLLVPDRFEPILRQTCADSGVALALIPQLSGTRASGAARWLRPDKALVQLSLRYKWEDHFWFSFFHEAAHILRHGKREIFVDEDGATGEKEQDADGFAEDTLIPRAAYRAFIRSGRLSKHAISGFAREIGISPAIVVGRLQHDGHLEPSHCNDLRRRFQWRT